MMAPASDQIAGQFGITNSSVIALLTSVFVAAYGRSFPPLPRYDRGANPPSRSIRPTLPRTAQ